LPAVEAIVREVPAKSRVLDLGCGNGSFLARFRGRGWEIYGADLSETGIEFCRSNYDGIRFFLADITQTSSDVFLKECGGPVDAVISTEVVEHLFNPRAYARLCFEMLKPGGLLVLSTPYHGYLKNLALALAGAMDTHYLPLLDFGHIKFWSKGTLTTLLKEAGFTDIHFKGAGRLPYLWKSMVVRAKRPL
jgi:2-polyprenyl-6-hydroxyphenyl methylase/3-demethylubiquinone-9 3-methyltransferase